MHAFSSSDGKTDFKKTLGDLATEQIKKQTAHAHFPPK